MTEIVIDGLIAPESFGADFSAKQMREQLAGAGDVLVYINSVGGVVSEGTAIYNQLRRHPGKKTVIVDGVAASIASVVAMSGDEINMAASSTLMMHDPWSLSIGGAVDHENAAKALRTVRAAIMDAYQSRVADREQISAWMEAETWFTGSEAVDAGLADSVDQAIAAKAVSIPEGLFKHPPSVDPGAEHPEVTFSRGKVMQMQAQLQRARGV